MSNPDKSWGPQDQPTELCRYLASDGKYYNGYIDSPDYNPFKECFEKISKKIQEELDKSIE